MVLNLHTIANSILAPVNEKIVCTFVRTSVAFSPNSLEGVKTTQNITLTGNIQPFNAKVHNSFTKIQNLGDNNTRTENFYVVYLKGFATMRDQYAGVNDDVFYARGKKYTVVENIPWKSAGWTSILCRESNDDRTT